MNIRLFHRQHRLCAEIEGERCALGVRPVWASPLSRPGQFLALLDAKGAEITLWSEPRASLDDQSWRAAHLEMRRRDLTARIERIVSLREDNGAAYFGVETDRGARDFVATGLSSSVVPFGDNRLLIVDADGNRYEIADIAALDENSRALLDEVL